MSAIDIARDVIAKGIRPVPIGFKQKKPTDPRTGRPLSDWQNLRIDGSNADTYFNGAPQNVGAILGEPSGHLYDVDLDCDDAVELAPQFLPPTATFGRASKRGSHWLYRCASSGPTRQFKGPDKAMLVELRANGGQTVFPGSVHETGEEIDWTDPQAPIAVVDRADLETRVERLVEAVKAKRYGVEQKELHTGEWAFLDKLQSAPVPPERKPFCDDGPTSRKAARATGWVKTAEPAIAHKGGHDATIRAATGVACGFALSEEDAFVIMRDHFRAEPRWSDAELRHKVKSALTGMAIPWGSKLADEDRRGSCAPPTAPSTPETAASIPFLDVTAEYITVAPPKREWLLKDSRRPTCDGVLPLGIAASLIAAGGIGKTQVATALSIAVATGGQWFGCLNVVEPMRVLLVLGEEDAKEARRRIYNVARSLGVRPGALLKQIRIVPLASVQCALLEMKNGALVETAFLTSLRTKVREWVAEAGPFGLVVLDPLSRFAGPIAETDNAGGTMFVQVIESLIELSGGATILVTHHTNKVSRGRGVRVETSASRGSSSLTDGFRWVATMGVDDGPTGDDRLEDVVTLEFTKSNYSRGAKPILLRRDVENGGVLLPLDKEDQETVREFRASQDKRTKTAKAREEQSAKRAAEDTAKQERTQRQEQENRAAEEQAVIDVLRELPGTSSRELRSYVRAKLATCGSERCDAAVARLSLSGAVVVEKDGKASRHRVVEERLAPERQVQRQVEIDLAPTLNGGAPL